MESSTVEILDVLWDKCEIVFFVLRRKIAFSFVHPDVIVIVQQIGGVEGG